MWIDSRTREAGESGEGIINTIYNEWLNFQTSPATFIVAVLATEAPVEVEEAPAS